MGSDNVDIFKKIIFTIPSFRKMLAGITVLGVLYSILFFTGLKAFTGYQIPAALIAYIAALIFILPTLISGELLHRVIPDYPRRWGYFLAGSNQLILFIFSMILTGANSFESAWSIFWIALISIYLSNFVVLLLTLGYRHLKEISGLSLVQPGVVMAVFHVFIGKYIEVPLNSYFVNMGVAMIVAVALICFFFLLEFLIDANIKGISVTGLTSALLNKDQKKLDLGEPTRPDVQTLMLENQVSEARIAVPWIHPGPLEGFGGGRITSDIIESLNRGDSQGFFFHVPSTHKSDPTDPEDYKKILEAMGEPETVGKASRLVEEDYGEVKFYGRKVEGKKIVFMDGSESETNYDDYELSVFREIIDSEETMVVDLHNSERELIGDREEVWYNTEAANRLRDHFKDFLEVLEDKEVFEYRCGFKADSEDRKIFSLVEEVDGQKTLIFGIEGNEKGREMAEVEEEYEKEFDKVLAFTTDTHRSVHDLSSDKQVESGRLIDSIEEASENVSRGSLGFKNSKAASMNLLQEDYSGLIFSVNMLVRLIPVVLALMYLGLIIWVW